jgi:hypothetical protein
LGPLTDPSKEAHELSLPQNNKEGNKKDNKKDNMKEEKASSTKTCKT